MKTIYPRLFLGSGVIATDRYACVLVDTVSVQTHYKGQNLLFYAGEQLLGRLHADGRLEICAKYACDGYSPTVYFLGGWRRITPVPKKAGFFPAILHDFMRQFCEVEGCPWNRKDSDTEFYNALIGGGESPTISGTYYGAVSRVIGDIWYRFRKHDPTLRIRETTMLTP